MAPLQLPSLLGPATLSLKKTQSPLNGGGNAAAITDDLLIYQYKCISGKEQIEFNGTKISRPVTNKIEKVKANVPVIFNKNLFTLCESDYNFTESSGRATFAVNTMHALTFIFSATCSF